MYCGIRFITAMLNRNTVYTDVYTVLEYSCTVLATTYAAAADT